MSDYQGNLSKMQTEFAHPVQYFLNLDQKININALIGTQLKLTFLGEIYCIHCHRKTNKSFQQGYCYPCLIALQSCNLCMIHPERCLVYEGHCDPSNWAHANCQAENIIYLANSSELKIGITRATQIPTRFIDQGALQALPIMQAPNRKLAGEIELIFKKFLNDKTNWRAMLKNTVVQIDLKNIRDKVLAQAEADLKQLQLDYPADMMQILENQKIYEFHYPVEAYPSKIKTYDLDKNNMIEDILLGVKGQYMIFQQAVLNIRKFGGYAVQLSV